MPINIVEHPKRTNFVRPTYLSLTPGIHVVRFLEPLEEARFQEKHFIVTPTTPMTVKCLGDECPLCQNNRKIYQLHPKDYSKQRGYFARSDSYTLNVYDRTMIKVCPNTECGKEVGATDDTFPVQCPYCKTKLFDVKETMSNKVKLLQLSRTASQQLNDVEKTQFKMVNGERVIIPITSYDMVFSVSILSDKKVTTPTPAAMSNDVVEVPAEELLDKDTIMTLTPDEIEAVLSGVSLKDIFSARKPETTPEVEEPTSLPDANKEIVVEVQRKIDEMYNN